jgi:hypothetical protein
MAFDFEKDHMSLTMGSTNQESYTNVQPKVKNHIFLREKAPWVVLPDDGAERWGTMEDAHLIAPKKAD